MKVTDEAVSFPRPKDSSLEQASRAQLLGIIRQLCHLCNIFLGVELLRRSLTRHIANRAEDRPIKPRTVELAGDRPCNSRITVGIAAIQKVLVI